MNDQCVTYYSPSNKIISQYARDVCQQLAERGEPEFNNPDVIDGFAAFLNVIAQVGSKYLNDGHELLDSQQS